MTAVLRGAVALGLPTPAATQALRAALWSGEPGRDAFAAWAEATGAPSALPPIRRQILRELGPQLDGARRRHGVEPPARELATLLRAAGDRERRRWPVYVAAVRDLVADDEEPLVSGGLATSLAAYDDPGVRHSHDLERLAPTPATGEHPSGLPWASHAGRLPVRWGHPEDLDAIRARAVPDDRLGPRLLRLSVGDLLVVVLVHAVASRRRGSVRWASDAHLLAAAASDDDWAMFVRSVVDARLGPVVLPALTWVHEALGAEVPSFVLAEVTSAPPPDRLRHEVALAWAVAERERGPDLRSADGRVAAAALVRMAVWPSAGFLALDGGRRSRLRRAAALAAREGQRWRSR